VEHPELAMPSIANPPQTRADIGAAPFDHNYGQTNLAQPLPFKTPPKPRLVTKFGLVPWCLPKEARSSIVVWRPIVAGGV